jgi:predicted amidohydrolase
VLIGPDGTLIGKYRKVHLPGSVEPRAGERYQQLEKRYFEYGNLGFPAFRVDRWHDAIVGMMICNDRRWPEAWRLGPQKMGARGQSHLAPGGGPLAARDK